MKKLLILTIIFFLQEINSQKVHEPALSASNEEQDNFCPICDGHCSIVKRSIIIQ